MRPVLYSPFQITFSLFFETQELPNGDCGRLSPGLDLDVIATSTTVLIRSILHPSFILIRYLAHMHLIVKGEYGLPIKTPTNCQTMSVSAFMNFQQNLLNQSDKSIDRVSGILNISNISIFNPYVTCRKH